MFENDDFSQTQPSDGADYSPFPAGTYPATIAKIEQKSNASGWRGYSVQFKILDGEFKGRSLFHVFTMALNQSSHENAAEIIADNKSRFVGMLKNAGHPNPNQPGASPIVGLNVGIRVKIGKDQNNSPVNELTGTCSLAALASGPAPIGGVAPNAALPFAGQNTPQAQAFAAQAPHGHPAAAMPQQGQVAPQQGQVAPQQGQQYAAPPQGQQQPGQAGYAQQPNTAAGQQPGQTDGFDDDIPF